MQLPKELSEIIEQIHQSNNEELFKSLEILLDKPAESKMVLNDLLNEEYNGDATKGVYSAINNLNREIGINNVRRIIQFKLDQHYKVISDVSKRLIAKAKTTPSTYAAKRMDDILRNDSASHNVRESINNAFLNPSYRNLSARNFNARALSRRTIEPNNSNSHLSTGVTTTRNLPKEHHKIRG